jgi:hypothetical protein
MRNHLFPNSANWQKALRPGGGLAGLALCLGVFFGPSLAQASDWLTVAGTAVFSGRDHIRARANAIAEAHQEAVYQVFGKDISAESLFVNLRLSGAIMGVIPCGQVTDSQMIKEKVIPIAGSSASRRHSEYRVELRARVSPCPSETPSGFWVEAGLNKTEFEDGDPVRLTLTASRDCHYYLFNILQDEKVLRLFPNRASSANRLSAGQRISFPSAGAGDKAKEIRPIAHLPPNVAQANEAIYVLALRRPVDFSGLGIQEGVFGLYDGRTVFINAMIRVVATIPVNQRAEQLIRFQIKSKPSPKLK